MGADGGASFWAVVGVGAAAGGLTAGTNDIIAQTDHFKGDVNWGHVGQMTTSGVFAGGISAGVGYGISTSPLINGSIESPMLRSLIASPVTSAVGHVTGGTTYGLLNGNSFSDAFSDSFEGIENSMIMGTAIGLGSTYISSRANGIDPWTGDRNYTYKSVGAKGKSVSVKKIKDSYLKQNGLDAHDIKYEYLDEDLTYLTLICIKHLAVKLLFIKRMVLCANSNRLYNTIK